MNIAQQLKEIGYSDAYLAFKTGASVASVRNWLKGTKPMAIYQQRLDRLLAAVKQRKGK